MSVAEPSEATSSEELGGLTPPTRPEVYRRPFFKRVMHVVRRSHLYLGLFLLPWAVLYGVTAFLFNHPTAFSDSPSTTFGQSELADTPMESPPKPAAVAEDVVKALNERSKDGKNYSLVEPEKAKYTREFAFASAKSADTEVNILFDVNNPGGTVRTKGPAPAAAPKNEEKAPFAISGSGGSAKGPQGKGGGPRGEGGPKGRGERGERSEKGGPKAELPSPGSNTGPLMLADPLHERMKAATPVVLERTGFATGEVTVTSVPDLSFLMSDGTKTWRVTYNSLNGSVGGQPEESAAPPPQEELSTRRFLTRLHTTHGFPGNQNAKWFWAVLVDAMAFVMVFWGVSGIFMWWQLKSTRIWGALVLLLSAVSAVALVYGMYALLVPR